MKINRLYRKFAILTIITIIAFTVIACERNITPEIIVNEAFVSLKTLSFDNLKDLVSENYLNELTGEIISEENRELLQNIKNLDGHEEFIDNLQELTGSLEYETIGRGFLSNTSSDKTKAYVRIKVKHYNIEPILDHIKIGFLETKANEFLSNKPVDNWGSIIVDEPIEETKKKILKKK